MTTAPDIRTQNRGSIWLVKADTAAGQDWLDEHVGDSDTIEADGGILVEARYVPNIIEHAIHDGLAVA